MIEIHILWIVAITLISVVYDYKMSKQGYIPFISWVLVPSTLLLIIILILGVFAS